MEKLESLSIIHHNGAQIWERKEASLGHTDAKRHDRILTQVHVLTTLRFGSLRFVSLLAFSQFISLSSTLPTQNGSLCGDFKSDFSL